MPSKKKNFSDVKSTALPELKESRIGVVSSQWNPEITDALAAGCVKTLKQAGVKEKNITRIEVPGSFELPSAAKMLVENKKVDAVICLGCIIKGETRHDEFIAQAVAKGIMDLNLRYNIPFVFGVLTCDDMKQAQERAGGNHGNKGVEAAAAAIKMIAIRNSLRK